MPGNDAFQNSAARTKQRSANIVDAGDVMDPCKVGLAGGVQALTELCVTKNMELQLCSPRLESKRQGAGDQDREQRMEFVA